MALSIQSIDRFITPGSPLARAGGARALLRATGGNLAGAAFLAALARKESSFGATAGRFKNNFWGWGVHLGPNVNTSPSVEAGARKVWQGLQSGLYRGAGLKTPTAIIQRYAPPSENNTALYQQQVNSWFSQMGLSPQTDIFSSSTVPVPGATPPTAPGTGGLPPQVTNNLDSKRLMMLLANQRGRSLRGMMPAPGFQSELTKIVSAALPNAQTGATARLVGAGVTQAATAAASTAGALAVRAGQAIVAKAVPYSWGGGNVKGPTLGTGRGAGTKGFDCSSFAQYIWAKAGVSIPRTTYQQIKVGAAVPSLAQAQPGDLLFPHAGHVQIYIGNGQVIEEPRTGGHAQVATVRSKYIAIRRPSG